MISKLELWSDQYIWNTAVTGLPSVLSDSVKTLCLSAASGMVSKIKVMVWYIWNTAVRYRSAFFLIKLSKDFPSFYSKWCDFKIEVVVWYIWNTAVTSKWYDFKIKVVVSVFGIQAF